MNPGNSKNRVTQLFGGRVAFPNYGLTLEYARGFPQFFGKRGTLAGYAVFFDLGPLSRGQVRGLANERRTEVLSAFLRSGPPVPELHSQHQCQHRRRTLGNSLTLNCELQPTSSRCDDCSLLFRSFVFNATYSFGGATASGCTSKEPCYGSRCR